MLTGNGILKLKQQIKELHRTIRNQKEKIKKLERKVDASHEQVNGESSRSHKLRVIESESDTTKAAFLLEQIDAFGRENYRWSEFTIRKCIIWKAKSPRAYEMARQSNLISLPSYSTLQRYIGPSSLKEGFSPLIKKRLEEEIKLLTPEEKLCTIMFDEMSIKPQCKFVKQVGRVIGRASLWNRNKFESAPLANKLLCFVLTGLTFHYRIPVAYFLTKDLDSEAQLEMLESIIRSCEDVGFKIVRAVCDCISFNVKTFVGLCGGELKCHVPHPCDPNRKLFISFDPCHVVKNLRNQFINRKKKWRNQTKPISADSIRELYKLQTNKTVKPVRFLSRKVVNPTPFEKMNVSRAVRLFSSEVTAALIFQRDTEWPGFENIDATIEFMTFVRKWFEV